MSNQEQLITLWVDCPDCDGNGFTERGPECSQPASSCCGGCYVREACNVCEEGEVSITIDDSSGADLIKAIIREDFEEAKRFINDTYFMNDQYKTNNSLCTLRKNDGLWVKLSKN